ncbi:MAG TPA: hypothetical protein PK867_29340, partial [Pirellulales bacterium]|nr:hypothetical protein [Pirellulales bacterium]
MFVLVLRFLSVLDVLASVRPLLVISVRPLLIVPLAPTIPFDRFVPLLLDDAGGRFKRVPPRLALFAGHRSPVEKFQCVVAVQRDNWRNHYGLSSNLTSKIDDWGTQIIVLFC